jgi:hypothetical protein
LITSADVPATTADQTLPKIDRVLRAQPPNAGFAAGTLG